MIQVENLTKYYGDLAAIKDVSLNVDKSRFRRSPEGRGRLPEMRRGGLGDMSRSRPCGNDYWQTFHMKWNRH